jgi:hypothetical protein
MANPDAPTLVTTLSAAAAVGDTRISLTSATGLVAGSIIVVGHEVMEVVTADTTANTAETRRGVSGTRQVAHISGADVFGGAKSEFTMVGGRPARSGYSGSLGLHAKMVLPLNTVYVDPDTGYEYRLVDCQSAFVVGEWVTIDSRGLATQLAVAQEGRVGIVIEVAASDDYAWVIVGGLFASAVLDSDVSTAVLLGANVGYLSPYDSDTDVLIQNARCTVAPVSSSVGTLGDAIGTVYIDNPWTSGIANFVS